jgi:hypothetical protein
MDFCFRLLHHRMSMEQWWIVSPALTLSLSLSCSFSLSLSLSFSVWMCANVCVCVFKETKPRRKISRCSTFCLSIGYLKERAQDDDVFSSLLGSDVFVKCSIQLAIIWKQVKFDQASDDGDDDR